MRRQNNDFFTGTLGLRRVKKTVNFDAPDVYHLYYGDETGTPGSVMTYFPFPNIGKGRHGAGEVGTTVFSVPAGTLGFWQERLEKSRRHRSRPSRPVSATSGLAFDGPDGERFALVEVGRRRAVRHGPAMASAPTRRSAASTPRRCGCVTAARPRSS